MAAVLTEKEFSKHVNTKFLVNLDGAEPIELELVEVKHYQDQLGEREGMERFSLFFLSSPDVLLQQATYSLSHEKMGSLDIFMVPIGRQEKGCSYEAVFNYFISSRSDEPGL